MRNFRRLIPLILAISLPGCAAWRHRPPPPPAAIAPRTVGTVALVNEKMRFVLLDVGSLYTPAPGTALRTFSGDTQTATLTVGPEKKRPFIAADVVSGEPKAGDRVEE